MKSNFSTVSSYQYSPSHCVNCAEITSLLYSTLCEWICVCVCMCICVGVRHVKSALAAHHLRRTEREVEEVKRRRERKEERKRERTKERAEKRDRHTHTVDEGWEAGEPFGRLTREREREMKSASRFARLYWQSYISGYMAEWSIATQVDFEAL